METLQTIFTDTPESFRDLRHQRAKFDEFYVNVVVSDIVAFAIERSSQSKNFLVPFIVECLVLERKRLLCPKKHLLKRTLLVY